MKYAYTICSANFLPYAKSVGDSLVKHNPDYRFIIFLLDRYPAVDVSYFAPHLLIHAEQMGIAAFAEMNQRYNIFEFSCAFKAYAADWTFENKPDCELLFYFDSDILIFNKLTVAENLLEKSSILITPHVSTSTEFESRIYLEKTFLRSGVYNAGFFGLKNTVGAKEFLRWWKTRLKDLSYNDVNNGLFVDQLWLNFAPILFRDDVTVLYDPGYNLSYWNMEERRLEKQGDTFLVNGNHPLVFFHFSGCDIFDKQSLSKYYADYTFKTHPEYLPLFQSYKSAAAGNSGDDFFRLPPLLGTVRQHAVQKVKTKRIFGIRINKRNDAN